MTNYDMGGDAVINTQKETITQATANQIRNFRQKQNLSQEQLALKADLNPAYLGQIERGLKCPTIETLYKIVCALDISLPEFFAFDVTSRTTAASDRLQTAILAMPPDKLEHFTQIVEELITLHLTP